eukprot:CAMPEP_0118666536 /NCGR_PEP_ID=MMETSP0785-20121206/19269_1 /TAXON_ID=91992 /ORGANISM="Bolidomonas pacifica, Strain CCMP 1866" /LENGTH=94 /DNA_ID=CAMNT_0006560857 /DNA_START=177 /DNA_END=458 /DNA_ORIENTATION=+
MSSSSRPKTKKQRLLTSIFAPLQTNTPNTTANTNEFNHEALRVQREEYEGLHAHNHVHNHVHENKGTRELMIELQETNKQRDEDRDKDKDKDKD